MKHLADTYTAELFGLPKKRGRPPKVGGAMSGAERQRRYRLRKAAKTVTVTLTHEQAAWVAQLIDEYVQVNDGFFDTSTLEALLPVLGKARGKQAEPKGQRKKLKP
ncbi:hypothetical protein ACTSKR_09620 [Chitinibacteraceae bacterium HSL-7]